MELTINVPDDRVAEFYTMFGVWLSRDVADDSSPELSEHDAARIYSELRSTGQQVVRTMAEHAGTWLTKEQICEGLKDVNVRGLNGVLGGIARIARRNGYQRLWRWKGKEKTYFLPDAIGRKFLTAIKNMERDAS